MLTKGDEEGKKKLQQCLEDPCTGRYTKIYTDFFLLAEKELNYLLV